MLTKIGVDSVDELIDQTIPAAIRLKQPLQLPAAQTEHGFLKSFKSIADKNQVFRSMIGLGYHDTITPGVIQRNILENPGWYTAYTPYQAEIAQGRLEALINFQTMVTDLTGMELANASLLDEGTAAAEAMSMLFATRKGKKKKAAFKFFVDQHTLPQTQSILNTRATPIGIELVTGDVAEFDATDESFFGILLQYPNSEGDILGYPAVAEKAKANDINVAVAVDLLAMALLTPPGEWGADVVVGTTQRFGVPLGFGGPHAAFFATKEAYKRQIPGRIIGVSQDRDGNKAYRMALQTREQHIKRERATSNICTAQVLLAVIAGMYGVYHGPEGIKTIATNVHGHTQLIAKGVEAFGFKQLNGAYFDTIKIEATAAQIATVRTLAEKAGINFRYAENFIGIAVNQTTAIEDVQDILTIFAEAAQADVKSFDLTAAADQLEISWADQFKRSSEYMTHPVFHAYRSEHELLRYMKRLENKDISLAHSMISLGSCTMKLNATAEMIPITWPSLASIHPFAPANQTEGYFEIFRNLEGWLNEITGFAGTSLQPNSGAQGEFAGLMVIKAYHEDRGDHHRNICIIPTSAHGTNPASAALAGMKIVLVKCDDAGNIDVADLREKAEANKENLSALMVTYPSTHGVYEESIIEICNIIHENGGQVYMDGANMNAQVGLTSPANIGADVCHLNLHKTFAIPHGGGGPGIGPICVAEQLVPFLPGSPLTDLAGGEKAITAISSAPWGSAGVLAISYAYIAMMGSEGLTNATKLAILNANYIQSRLKDHFPVLYVGANGRNAHELILDCRQFKTIGIEVEDIAKRLIDYGFHAPTVSFPVAGTLMIEPTESESLEELDRFCDAMVAIRQEVKEIEDGKAEAENNVLKNAPHTQALVLNDNWEMPYSREKAGYPLPYLKEAKIWPSVRRIDNAFGDRNLMCSCIPVSEYAEAEA